MYAGITAAIGGAMLSGCGGSAVNKAEFDKIKTAAVLVFTVPQDIEYRADPKENKKTLLQAVAAAAAKGDPAKAASLSYASFAETLNGKVPFRILTADEVRNNAAFNAINPTSFSPKAKKQEGTMGMLMSLAGTQNRMLGMAPDGLPQFGLSNYGANPLDSDKDNQMKYLMAAMKALNVDAAIVVSDMGYSFSCNACIGGTGDASTGSGFNSALVSKDGKLVGAVQQWFGTSGGHAAMVGYVVNPLQHDSLFKSHGVR
ncbi:MAG TPA: hypothetical protein VF678_14280, partial [bacterium]